MKITQDVREYAAQKEIEEQAALGGGMKEKAEEFVAAGEEILSKWLRRSSTIHITGFTM
jgi:phosphomethylpyrimidine synthase